MANIKTAIFPVAGLGTRFLPATKAMPKEMLPIVDKPLIQFVVEEAREAGVERFVFVTGRQKQSIENHFDHMVELEQVLAMRGKTTALAEAMAPLGKPGELIFLRQQKPFGLGHAIWCARHIVGKDPFGVLLADDFIMSEVPILKKMVESYESGALIATSQIQRAETGSYGIINPGDKPGQVLGLVEKPNPELAPSTTAVMGRYILPPSIMSILEKQKPGAGDEIQLTDALQTLALKGQVQSFDMPGKRFDCGTKLGYIQATISSALARDDLRYRLRPFLSQIQST